MKFHELVRAGIKGQGLTSGQVAEVLGTSSSWVRRLMVDKASQLIPNERTTIDALALVLDIDPLDLWHAAIAQRMARRDPEMHAHLDDLGVWALLGGTS